MRTPLLLAAALSALLAALPARADPPAAPSAVAATDDLAGRLDATLPKTIDAFTRVGGVTTYPQAAAGVSVRYMAAPVRADVYLYPAPVRLDGDPASEEFRAYFAREAEALQLVVRAPDGGEMRFAGARVLRHDGALPFAVALFRGGADAAAIDTVLALAVRGERLIKVRMTFPSAAGAEAQPAVAAFLAAAGRAFATRP